MDEHVDMCACDDEFARNLLTGMSRLSIYKDVQTNRLHLVLVSCMTSERNIGEFKIVGDMK